MSGSVLERLTHGETFQQLPGSPAVVTAVGTTPRTVNVERRHLIVPAQRSSHPQSAQIRSIAVNRHPVAPEIDVAIKRYPGRAIDADRGNAVVPTRIPGEIRDFVSGIKALVPPSIVRIFVNTNTVVSSVTSIVPVDGSVVPVDVPVIDSAVRVVDFASAIDGAQAGRHTNGLDLVVPISSDQSGPHSLLGQVAQIGVNVKGSALEVPVEIGSDPSLAENTDGRNLVPAPTQISRPARRGESIAASHVKLLCS